MGSNPVSFGFFRNETGFGFVIGFFMTAIFLFDALLYVFFQISCSILLISLLTIMSPSFLIFNGTLVSFFTPLKSRQNILLVLLSLEIAIASLCFFSIFYSLYVPNLFSQIIVLVLLVLAGAESALGLALLMLIFRIHGMISFDLMGQVKG